METDSQNTLAAIPAPADDLPVQKANLCSLSRQEVENIFKEMGEPKFRAAQLLRWIWHEGVLDFDKMSNMSKALRDKLAARFVVEVPKIIFAQNSDDGTVKYLMKLADGKTIETVWIPRNDQDRVTVCISTQIGCRMGCTFCLTAQQKVERNMSAGEIAAQLLALPNRDKITNVVVMGMGEPFDNYEALMGAIDLMSDPQGMAIGPRHITVSTSGLVPKIELFLRSSKARLAVSLNAPTDEIRSEIMPINRAYNLDKLLGSLRTISREMRNKSGGSRFYITFEYILIKDLNDRPEHARELVRRVHGIPCKINLLLYNENPNVPYKRPSMDDVADFRQVLSDRGLLNFIRSSRGRDISAACGQLASEHKRRQIAPATTMSASTGAFM